MCVSLSPHELGRMVVGIMDHFADDCVFYMPRGSSPRGDGYVGKAEVRAGLAKRFTGG